MYCCLQFLIERLQIKHQIKKKKKKKDKDRQDYHIPSCFAGTGKVFVLTAPHTTLDFLYWLHNTRVHVTSVYKPWFSLKDSGATKM